MMVLALTTEQSAFWQVSLAVGGVVLVVVIGLLTLLLYLVRSIDIEATRLLGVAGQVAGNTSQVKGVGAVVSTLEEIGDEANAHARLLGV